MNKKEYIEFTRKQLQKALKSMKKSEIVEEILNLYDGYEEIQIHYDEKFSSFKVQSLLYNNMCNVIKKEFEPDKGLPAARVYYLKEQVYKFKLRCNYPILIAELHFNFSRACFKYLIEYRDIIYDPIDREIVNSFNVFCEIISKIGFDKLAEETVGSIEEFLLSVSIHDSDILKRLLRIIHKHSLPFKLP